MSFLFHLCLHTLAYKKMKCLNEKDEQLSAAVFVQFKTTSWEKLNLELHILILT